MVSPLFNILNVGMVAAILRHCVHLLSIAILAKRDYIYTNGRDLGVKTLSRQSDSSKSRQELHALMWPLIFTRNAWRLAWHRPAVELGAESVERSSPWLQATLRLSCSLRPITSFVDSGASISYVFGSLRLASSPLLTYVAKGWDIHLVRLLMGVMFGNSKRSATLILDHVR